jgi:hypothetical protein
MAHDLAEDKDIVATIAQVAADPGRYRIIGYDPDTGHAVDLTLTEAVEARFDYAASFRPGSPSAAAAWQRAIAFANAAGYEVRGLRARKRAGRRSR